MGFAVFPLFCPICDALATGRASQVARGAEDVEFQAGLFPELRVDAEYHSRGVWETA